MSVQAASGERHSGKRQACKRRARSKLAASPPVCAWARCLSARARPCALRAGPSLRPGPAPSRARLRAAEVLAPRGVAARLPHVAAPPAGQRTARDLLRDARAVAALPALPAHAQAPAPEQRLSRAAFRAAPVCRPVRGPGRAPAQAWLRAPLAAQALRQGRPQARSRRRALAAAVPGPQGVQVLQAEPWPESRQRRTARRDQPVQ